jgi:hypothetical protein
MSFVAIAKKAGFSPATYRDFARKTEVAQSNVLSSGYSEWP